MHNFFPHQNSYTLYILNHLTRRDGVGRRKKSREKKLVLAFHYWKKVIRRVNENIEDEKKEREFVVESECCVLLESMMKCKLF